jgi:hypothetical protein
MKINIGTNIYDENFKIVNMWGNWHMNRYYCGKDAWHFDTLLNKFIMSSNEKIR